MTKQGTELNQLAQQNKQKITTLANEKNQIEKAASDAEYNLKWQVYDEKIRALENERDQAIDAIRKKAKSEAETRNAEINTLYEPVAKVRRIVKFLKLPHVTATVTDIKDMVVREHWNNAVKCYSEDLGFLIKEDQLNIHLAIVANGKPKNCYSLIAFGNCTFINSYDDPVMREPQESHGPEGWQNAAYFKGANPRIDLTIKTAVTPTELKTWAEKNKQKILADFLKEYQTVKAEYIEVLKTYTMEDFPQFTEEE